MINDYREGNANAARAKFISVILRKWLYAAAVLLLMIVNPLAAQETGGEQKLQPFVDFLDREGRDPLALVLDQIKSYDLLNFWNCGTFFHQWHPGKTYSIRFHHLALSVEKEIVPDAGTARSTAGMERYAYRWVRMADGLWDSAFEARGNRPVAFSLKDNVLGATAYTGNQVHKAAPGQTMYDANDAIIFLAPLESLHNTAMVDIIYTEAFKQELARRYRILYNDTQLKQQFERDGVDNLEALVEKNCLARPAALIPQAQTLPPADAWKRPRN